MATFTELATSRNTGIDLNGVRRGTRNYLVDTDAESVKTDPAFDAEIPITWDGMTRDRVEVSAAPHTPAHSLVNAVYSTDGAGRFHTRPEEPEPGELQPRSSSRKERRTYPAGQTLYEERVGTADQPASVYLWNVEEGSVVVRPYVLAMDVVIEWGTNAAALLGQAAVYAHEGELHDVIPGGWFQFEVGGIRPIGGGKWRATYQWVSDPGIFAPTDDEGNVVNVDNLPNYLGPPIDPQHTTHIVGPWRQVVAKPNGRPDPDQAQLPWEFEYTDQGRRISGGHLLLPGIA